MKNYIDAPTLLLTNPRIIIIMELTSSTSKVGFVEVKDGRETQN